MNLPESTPWEWLERPEHSGQETVILVHGLNNRPETMNSLGTALAHGGNAVLRCNLRGHYGPISGKYDCSAEAWLADFRQTYLEARSQSPADKIHIVAFSLGCTITLNYLVDNPETQVASVVLLAPAIKLTAQSQAGSIVKLFGQARISIPSIAPKTHRAFSFTPLRAYLGLFRLIDRLNRPKALKRFRSLKVLVVIDKKDELVSARRLGSWIQSSQLDSWQLEHLSPTYGITRHKHHLIIDDQCLDSTSWKRLVKLITNRIKENCPAL